MPRRKAVPADLPIEAQLRRLEELLLDLRKLVSNRASDAAAKLTANMPLSSEDVRVLLGWSEQTFNNERKDDVLPRRFSGRNCFAAADVLAFPAKLAEKRRRQAESRKQGSRV